MTAHAVVSLLMMPEPPPGPMDPSSAPAGASTGRLLLRRQINRTALPRTCSASIELVARFCCITTSEPPTSSSTMYRVVAPRYTTSRTWPVAVQESPSTAASSSLIAIFSGRIVKGCGSPAIAAAVSPSSTLETPTNPATKPVAGRS